MTRRGARRSSRLRQGARATILCVLVVGLGWLVWQRVSLAVSMDYFRINNFVVEGNRRVPSAVIIESLGLTAGSSIFQVDLRALALQVGRNPWIKTVRVSRRLPATLQVYVSEREARAVAIADRAYLISDDGLILQEASSVEMAILPLLRLYADHPLGTGERIDPARVERGARLWQRFHHGALGADVQAREIQLKGDGSYHVVLGPGLPSLYFGEGDDVQRQLDRLARVLEVRRAPLRALEYADLRFADKVIVKPLSKEGA